MSSKSATHRLAELVMEQRGEELRAWLVQQRDRGDSFERLAADLRHLTEGEVDVTSNTVRAWVTAYEAEARTSERAAS